MAQLIAHTVTIAMLLGAAVALSLLGHDGTPAWTALGGYLGFAGVRAVANGGHK